MNESITILANDNVDAGGVVSGVNNLTGLILDIINGIAGGVCGVLAVISLAFIIINSVRLGFAREDQKKGITENRNKAIWGLVFSVLGVVVLTLILQISKISL
ncbi:hypothetical protein C4M97_00530 [Mycoplasmopsis pullorum]|uniref:Mbov_0395 family pilin-like conjugal transfer protein n=1 Tax=Mycoplasmopsis pullorum TaxID=48003 RepID=UPI001118696A|nr:hypothetical protein [Mycoplasmopsis pullorum]TNK81612.1 hypothetical protein C4M94_03580 [Mycoplasmopsis pullorum]TNK82871.1 hypothetical protein C4M93_03375 [Mycoplasmopsis pullorum]TNK82889.1 hypothetical protein C4M80_02015 [Mycoplasmopsis pullorum]TNK84258.1 hypothetical protein C4M92_03690 [Mycoplasmopsis pullorum]TNK84288.1 hypothetical protein C4M81_02720 [Mycoplasmopsis pullorum]